LLGKLAEGAREASRDPSAIRRMIEVKVSYDRDPERALDACRWWAALALSPEQKEGIDDPVELERVADANAERAHTRFIVSSDPEEVVERIGGYLDMGFDDLVLHAPGADQGRFLEQFSEDVAPALRARAELPRLRYLTEVLVWMGGHATWSAEMVAEQVGDYDGQVTRADLSVAEQAGLIVREELGVRLSEFGWNVAAGLGEALRSDRGTASGRLEQSVKEVLPELADDADPFRLQHLAQVLVWIGGDRLLPQEMLIEQYGEDQRARVVRELEAAEGAGIITREQGGVRLTARGWDVAAADDE
jgi:hypothetical protein